MTWDPRKAVADFVTVARLAGVELRADDIRIEELPAPHVPPKSLPGGYMAVYVFSYRDWVLKVGKAGPKSQARYTSQHYNLGSARSTLAASLIEDADLLLPKEETNFRIDEWIKKNVDRVNILMPSVYGIPVLTLLESFLQCRLRPRYEGFRSQRE